MLVSHRFDFIYTKTVKTGGTSVESYFERFCMPEGAWSLSHGRDEHVSEAGIIGFRGQGRPKSCTYWNHMSAALIKKNVGPEVWGRYFKFCVIRNPYDKAVSAFYFSRRANRRPGERYDLNRERRQFEEWLRIGKEIPIDRDRYLIDGQFCLDDVVRYETLHADLARVCARLGVPWDPSLLPTFKQGIRPTGAATEGLYTEKSRAIVRAAFAFELEHFKYTFPAGS
jgi:hypothetical protein